ncbi:hypothetical protein Tco_0684813, partial [Tanacetum coccineum]
NLTFMLIHENDDNQEITIRGSAAWDNVRDVIGDSYERAPVTFRVQYRKAANEPS